MRVVNIEELRVRANMHGASAKEIETIEEWAKIESNNIEEAYYVILQKRLEEMIESKIYDQYI